MTDPDLALMQNIQKLWATELAAAVGGTAVSEAFLAALVANESGGNADAVRFEPAVFSELAEVILGTRKGYSPAGIHHTLGRVELLDFIEPAGVSDFTDCLERLAELATSRSLTQIMGWHFVEMSHMMPGKILSAGAYLTFTIELLVYFANHYSLDLVNNVPELLRCWNTGKPDGVTSDPHYVANGVKRMSLYGSLAS
jgi:hypothetical protein